MSAVCLLHSNNHFHASPLTVCVSTSRSFYKRYRKTHRTPFMPAVRTVAELSKHPPPSCLPQISCGNAPCECSAAAFYEEPRRSAFGKLATDRSKPLNRKLRVFFLDGHSGPMNDMTATLRSMGVQTENIEAMLMAQAEQKRSFIDVLGERLRTPPPSSMPERCAGRLLGKRSTRDLFYWLRGNTKASPGGECTLLASCERKRCRDALASDGLRREFARQFGAAFERSVDVVACNFPTWQCALFMHVNVTVIMRFTHRWDHHLQGYYVDPGVATRPASTWTEPLLTGCTLCQFRKHSDATISTTPSRELVASIELSNKWKRMRQNYKTLKKMNEEGKMKTLAQAAHETLRAMTAQRNVLFAASNPYDAR